MATKLSDKAKNLVKSVFGNKNKTSFSTPQTPKVAFPALYGNKPVQLKAGPQSIQYKPSTQPIGPGNYQLPSGTIKQTRVPKFNTPTQSSGNGTIFPRNTSYSNGSGTSSNSSTSNSQLTLGSFYDGTKPYLMDFDEQQKDIDRLYKEEYTRLAPYYDELTGYEKTKLGNYLSDIQSGLDRYVEDQTANFQADRYALDKNEASSGTLFSTGRVARRADLSGKYTRDYEDTLAKARSGMRNAALDTEYNLGSNALKGMNFNLGTATFDANTGKGTVNRGTTSGFNLGKYQGRIQAERKSTATKRAYERLGRVQVDTLPTYYNNN